MGYRVAVFGASGNVGREMLHTLAQRHFPVDEVIALAGKRSVGLPLSYGDNKTIKCRSAEGFDFSEIDICLMSAGGSVAAVEAPRIAGAGAVVIDNSSYWRMDPDVPLVVPEVNPEAIDGYRAKNIIANPNCSTAQMLVALKPIHEAAGIKRIVVATYQSVSGAGKEAVDELYNQTKGFFMGSEMRSEKFGKRIAFNVIPQIDSFLPDGSTKEERKMEQETHKMLDPNIAVTAFCVRVPVFVGHAEAINLELHRPLSADDARELLRESPGCTIIDDPEENQYATPIDAAGEDDVFISRIRADRTVPHGLNLWVVADNLRKGAALNAVQIAELLIERGFQPKSRT